MHGLRHAIHSQFTGLVDAVTPASTVSRFESERMLTPEEFVAAGDQLVSAVGSWRWRGAQGKLAVPFLPADKQYLITENVPCKKRASTALAVADQEDQAAGSSDGDEAWVLAAGSSGAAGEQSGPSTSAANLDDDDDEDTFRPPAASEELRSYNLYITYRKYYQVPQFWLVGYSHDKKPLTVKEMSQDVHPDYMEKTLTVDPFPHIDKLTTLSIHPCKHATTMKVFGDQQIASGKEFPVQHYLFLFLKFISGVVPTIVYDYSVDFVLG